MREKDDGIDLVYEQLGIQAPRVFMDLEKKVYLGRDLARRSSRFSVKKILFAGGIVAGFEWLLDSMTNVKTEPIWPFAMIAAAKFFYEDSNTDRIIDR